MDPVRFLTELGESLFGRFTRLRVPAALDCAIIAQQRAVDLTDDGHRDRPARYYALSCYLGTRFRNVQRINDLECALIAGQVAVDITPQEDPDRPARLSSLAFLLQDRFQSSSEPDDIDRAIAAGQLASECTPEGHPEKAARLCTLAIFLKARFERLGKLNDLDDAIYSCQRAVDLTPQEHPERPTRLGHVAGFLQSRFERLGKFDDLEFAISTGQLALGLTPEGHPERSVQLSILCTLLHVCFKRLGQLADLEQALTASQLAIDLTPEGHHCMPSRVNTLSTLLQTRFERLGDLDDLFRALTASQLAVEITTEGHPDKPKWLLGFSTCLRGRFICLGDIKDLERAIAAGKRAVECTPKGHPEKAARLYNLGLSLEILFEQTQSKLRFNAAIGAFMDATVHSSGEPSTRLDSAQKCVALLSRYPHFGSADLLLLAHARIVQVFPDIVWLGHSVNRRYEESAKLGHLVTAAIAAFISLRSNYQAIEWMETGRFLVWSQVLSLREPLGDLEKEYPHLAVRLQDILSKLQLSGYESSASAFTTFRTDTIAADIDYRRLVSRYEDILTKIRRYSGFENFMRPPKIDSLLPFIENLDGPVVFINVHSSSCDALALFPNGSIIHIALPSLTESRAQILRSHWIQNLRDGSVRMRAAMTPYTVVSSSDHTSMSGRIMKYLWLWVMKPIMQALNPLVQTPSDRLPHITWCPTGPLTQLPLHAAGIYYDDHQTHRSHVFDFVVSSYTPSLSALLRAHRQSRAESYEPSVLVLAQPRTPGHSPLPGTQHECHQLNATMHACQIPVTNLCHEQGTVTSTLAAMNDHSWIHLACHGIQHLADPTQSAFVLYDGHLTLSALMATATQNAELAFLSACQTATGDEKIPEESAHLAAGMLAVGFKGVVATMWSIYDKETPIVSEAYYKRLIQLRASGTIAQGYTGAAYALHDAVEVLRDHVGEQDFVKWAPFVHFGA